MAVATQPLKPNSSPKTTVPSVSAADVIAELEKHILVDGFKLVFDVEKSRGSRFVDAATGRELIDLYSFYASQPVGFNHPYFERPEVREDLLRAAESESGLRGCLHNSIRDLRSDFRASNGCACVATVIFIEGGAVAVENALKAAMDWKVRKNLAAGRGERGTEIIHFERAFHGRTGYTMSLTNTDPRKVAYYPKFPWPRISTPAIDFSLPAARRTEAVIEKEKRAEKEILEAFTAKTHDIAAIIIEPVQGEGGDEPFSSGVLEATPPDLRRERSAFDFRRSPIGHGNHRQALVLRARRCDAGLLAFGKKAQVCGVMAGPRLDEVKDNCFRLPSG